MLLLASIAVAHAATCEDADPRDCSARCDGGEALACVQLADLHLSGRGVEQNPAIAAALLEKSCAKGEGCDRLGVMLLEGTGIAADPTRGAALLDQACAAGSGLACRNLAITYDEGLSVAIDDAKAAALYQKGCAIGDAPACHNLGVMKLSGEGSARDPAAAAALHTRGCTLGFPGSCVALGMLYASGVGVPYDGDFAQRLLDPPCIGGNILACRGLGVLLQDGQPPEDLSRAATLFSVACEEKDLLACAYRGTLREQGAGTARDLLGAEADYRLACDGGLAYGCSRLAWMDVEYGRRTRGLRDLQTQCDAGEPWACEQLTAAPE